MAEELGHEPPALRDRPRLNDTEQFYFEFFNELSAGRTNNGFGPNAIATRDILDMADLHEVWSPESRLDLVRFVRVLDRVYFEQVAKKPHG